MYFFTADEHYGHANIIRYCNRPFKSVDEMNEDIIRKHNAVVMTDDVVIHAGDFSLAKVEIASKYVAKLNGHHIFLQGSHDHWLPRSALQIWEKNIDGIYVVVCHYAMRTWARSHYNSWQLYGHSHGTLPPIGKQWDIGVDNNDFYPVSFKKLSDIMKLRPDNPNLVSKSNT